MLLSQKLFRKIRIKFIPICNVNQQFLIIISNYKSQKIINEWKEKKYILKINFFVKITLNTLYKL